MLLLMISFTLVSVVLTYIMQVIIHETGHMIAGTLTGWKLVYLQIYHFTISKGNKFGLKVVPLTGFQCIMYPKNIKNNSDLYTLGGIIANLVLSCVGVYGMIKAFANPFMFVFSLSLLASGFALLLTNGIPHINKVCNDMACFILNRKDNTTKYYHNAQLLIAEQLFKGTTYKDIDKHLICLTSDIVENDIIAYHSVLEYYHHLDRDEYTSAKAALVKSRMNKGVSSDVQNIINLEMLYLEMTMDILTSNRTTLHNMYFSDDINVYIRQNEAKGSIHYLRVNGLWKAYNYYLNGDIIMSMDCIDRTIRELNSMEYVYLGELNFCLDHLEGIRNTMKITSYSI